MASSPENKNLLDYSNLQIPSSQVVLIYTEWNTEIINELMNGAKRIFSEFPQVTLNAIQVPGAVEIPFAISQYQKEIGASAYVAFGCVIRGETPHFDYVCKSVVEGITQLNCTIDSPVIFGVLTVNTIEQAHDRLGGKHGHKGEEAAIAALKMIAFKNSLKH